MGKYVLGVGVCFCGFYSAIVYAESNNKLEQIVVVGNKVARPINSIAANITVLSKEELYGNLTTSTRDLFQYTPGIDTESTGTRYGTESINIRGIGGNRVALLIDGVPLGDQFDIGNFSNATRDFINAGMVQRAEVLHGSASALYGSNAIGGVVALYTPMPSDLLKNNTNGGEILATYQGADTSSHMQAMFASGSESLGFLVGASLRDGHELDPVETVKNPDKRDYQRKSALLKLVADDHAGQSWRLAYMHQDSEAQSDLQSMLGSGRFRSTTKLLGDDHSSMDMFMGEYDIKALEPWIDSSVFRAYYQTSDISQSTFDERQLARTPVSIDRLFSYQQKTLGFELNLQKEIIGENGLLHQIGFGLEYQERATEELRDGASTDLANGLSSSSVLGEVFPLRDFPLSDAEEFGSYLEYSVSSERWTATAALRADHYKLGTTADFIYLEDNPSVGVVSLSESDISPKLGLVFHPTPSTDVYFQYTHGFRAPPFEDANIGLDIPLFNIRALPNPDLKSESSDGVDLGVRWKNDIAKLQLGFFRTNYEDFIETKVRLGIDPTSGRLLFQSQNLSGAVIEGLEAGWQIDLPYNLDFNGSLYLADGSNKDNDQPLNSVGPDQLVMGLGWSATSGKRALKLRSSYTGNWRDRDESGGELFKPDSHFIMDLFYSENLTNRVVFRAAMKNLSDKEYWNWSSVGGVAPDDPILPVLARPGRNFSVSFEFSW